MKSYFFALAFLLLTPFVSFLAAEAFAAESLSASVNPFIGTMASKVAPPSVPNGGRGGATHPAAVAPFGMIEWGPDTAHPETSGYNYRDTQIKGFSLTHLSGPGCANAGDLPFQPFIGPANLAPNWAPLGFNHADESASPGTYQVKLENGVQVDLTVTERTGLARLKFPEDTQKSFGVMLNTSVRGTGKTKGQITFVDHQRLTGTVEGGNFCGMGNAYKLHFAIQFDRPASDLQFKNGLAVISFAPPTGSLQMKVGISYVSRSNALLNLKSENADWSWPHLQSKVSQKWESLLGKIRVNPLADLGLRAEFYTALYHSLLHPNLASDVNGDYMGFDNKVHSVGTRGFYANFSGWDIYRSQVQLLALVAPDVASDIAQSLVLSGEQCGALPKWSQMNSDTGVMPGDPGPLILANLYAFGATNFDTASALKLMKVNALDPNASCNGHEIRYAAETYLHQGYLPLNSSDELAASITLEFVTSDFAISQFAKARGDDQLAQILLAKSSSWQSLWDPGTRHIRPKLEDGSWLSPFDPASQKGFTEGNGEQYNWLVPFNLGAIVQGVGGDRAASERLDSFFQQVNAGQEAPNLYIGNEPSFGTPWVYLWAHYPAGTQAAVRKILLEAFDSSPGGLPGNDDLGAISSWFVWSALGLYPEIPGVGGLAVASPLFSDIDVTLKDGHHLKIHAPQASQRYYVASASIDGRSVTKTWIPFADVAKGLELSFALSDSPTDWGSSPGDEPPSFR